MERSAHEFSSELSPLIIAEIAATIEVTCLGKTDCHPVILENAQAVRKLLSQHRHYTSQEACPFSLVKYKKGETIVRSGKISDHLIGHSGLDYCHVPLGLIVSGEVIVTRGSKSSQRLSIGDFIGLLETSEWISAGRNREIRDWTVVANTDLQIIFFSADLFSHDSPEVQEFKRYLTGCAQGDRNSQTQIQLPQLPWMTELTTESGLYHFANIVQAQED